MPKNITYYTIAGLAQKIESEHSEEEIRQLIRELIKNRTANFHERTDSVAMGKYVAVTKVCQSCGQPL